MENIIYTITYAVPLISLLAVGTQVSSGSGGAWSFNLSHQGDYAVLAAEQGLQVGVDIMKNTMPGKH